MPFKTRIAPSPTGDLHLGTARTAYVNWLAARASGGQFILRIDDTDIDRNQQSSIDVIFKSMDLLGLNYDNLIYQSKRNDTYLHYIKLLNDAGCLVALDNGALALKWADWMPRVWNDSIAGNIDITDTNIDQIDGRLILLRGGDKIGQPTYQFASVVDDWDQDINFIIRGTDHITNTAKQIAIWVAINYACHKTGMVLKPLPKFAHLGLITMGGRKLSKRDGASSMLNYFDQGYHPDALLNFMLRLGWGPNEDNKFNSVIPKEKALKLFLDAGNMRNSPAGLDLNKLNWYDKIYKTGKYKEYL